MFNCYNHGTNKVDFDEVINTEYDNSDVPLQIRFEHSKTQEFVDRIRKRYNSLNMKFMKYVNVKYFDWLS